MTPDTVLSVNEPSLTHQKKSHWENIKEYTPDVGAVIMLIAGAIFCGYAYLDDQVAESNLAWSLKASGFSMLGSGSFTWLSWRLLGGSQKRELSNEIHSLSISRGKIEHQGTLFQQANGRLESEIKSLYEERKKIEGAVKELDGELAQFRSQNKILIEITKSQQGAVEKEEWVSTLLEERVIAVKAEVQESRILLSKMVDSNELLRRTIQQLGEKEHNMSLLLTSLSEKDTHIGTLTERLEQAEGKLERVLSQMQKAQS